MYTILKTVLTAAGINFGYNGSGTSVYVSSISGLGEYDDGANSGWKYYVNGSAPSMGCGNYIPEDGDVIKFIYTSDYTNDSDSLTLGRTARRKIDRYTEI